MNPLIYHIFNRGVEKRKIFLDEKDYLRFIIGLYEFNDEAPALNSGYYFKRQPIEVRLQYPRKKSLVKILAFCLMPNHYHLMIQEVTNNGITAFMQKLGTGYTNYFNLKNDRVGPLFQGKYKSILLERERHLIHLPHYIHCNPLQLHESAKGKATKYLVSYPWSSLPDYLGKRNFPTVTSRQFLTEYLGTPKLFLKNMRYWLKGKNFDEISEVSLEPVELPY